MILLRKFLAIPCLQRRIASEWRRAILVHSVPESGTKCNKLSSIPDMTPDSTTGVEKINGGISRTHTYTT